MGAGGHHVRTRWPAVAAATQLLPLLLLLRPKLQQLCARPLDVGRARGGAGLQQHKHTGGSLP